MKINLWDSELHVPFFDSSIPQQIPNITPYTAPGDNRPCVIVCPGGAYMGKAEHEGEPIALWLNSLGINAFVLDYRVFPYRQPCAMYDLIRAIKYVRFNAGEFKINKNKIGIIGFSAGGHLVSSVMVHYGDYALHSDDIDEIRARPDFSILCYPVITMRDYTHEGTRFNLLGENPDENLIKYYSSEENVNNLTPPCFIWHTMTDDAVDIKNSTAFALALQQNNVLCELHTFSRGVHGLGLDSDHMDKAGQWTLLCENWLKNYII